MVTRHAVIADPFSTAREYAPVFRSFGVEPVAVLSRPQPLEVYRPTWQPATFEHVLRWSGDPADLPGLVERVRAFDPICVVTGAECGVEFADLLADLVTPGTGNDPCTSAARRDKWAMAQALHAAGMPTLDQICTDDPAAVRSWVGDAGRSRRPLVVKPVSSVGADNVHLVPAGGDWRAAFDAVLGTVNVLGQVNDRALVQEFAAGTEYIVDTFSADGRHGVIDVCRYAKGRYRDRIGIYESVDFLGPDTLEVEKLVPFTYRALDAVGIRNGCGHSEVVLTPDGPRMLDIAARPAGGGHQAVSRLATGDCHIDRTVRYHVSGEFRAGFELLRHVRAAFVSAPRAGVWRNRADFDAVDKLPTFHRKDIAYGPGATVPATVDIFTALGWVTLASPYRALLEADYAEIRALERDIVIEPAG